MMSAGQNTRPLPTLKPAGKQAAKPEVPVIATPEAEQKLPVELPLETGDTIKVELGLSMLADLDPKAYTVTHAQIELTEKARTAIKRLSLTLAQKGARLSSGKICDTSIPFAVVWLCERFSEAVAEK